MRKGGEVGGIEVVVGERSEWGRRPCYNGNPRLDRTSR